MRVNGRVAPSRPRAPTQDETMERVLRAIRERGPQGMPVWYTIKQAAARADVSVTYAAKLLQRAYEWGAVDRRRETMDEVRARLLRDRRGTTIPLTIYRSRE